MNKVPLFIGYKRQSLYACFRKPNPSSAMRLSYIFKESKERFHMWR